MTSLMPKQYANYLAVDLIEKLGNNDPTQEQIDLLESILLKTCVVQHLSFAIHLTAREVSCL